MTRYFRAKICIKSRRGPWALTARQATLTLSRVVSEAFEFLPADWPENIASSRRAAPSVSEDGLLLVYCFVFDFFAFGFTRHKPNRTQFATVAL